MCSPRGTGTWLGPDFGRDTAVISHSPPRAWSTSERLVRQHGWGRLQLGAGGFPPQCLLLLETCK